MAEVFRDTYRCSSSANLSRTKDYIASFNAGGKILLPPSALATLSRLKVMYPMLFRLQCPGREARDTHCGVLEFIANDGMMYLPDWMMANLGLSEGQLVNLSSVTLKSCTYAKFKPQSVDFLDISNPKAVLENSLRHFSCLTLGDTIAITYNDKKYYIKVVDVKPNRAVSIIECDMQLDFEAPEGYVEPVRQPPPAKNEELAPMILPAPDWATKGSGSSFAGDGKSLRSKSSKAGARGASAVATAAAGPTDPAVSATPPGALPFTFGKLIFPRPATAVAPVAAAADTPAPMVSFSGKGTTLRP